MRLVLLLFMRKKALPIMGEHKLPLPFIRKNIDRNLPRLRTRYVRIRGLTQIHAEIHSLTRTVGKAGEPGVHRDAVCLPHARFSVNPQFRFLS